MSTHKYIDRICVIAVLLVVMLTVGFMNGKKLGIRSVSGEKEYENRLFDQTSVHTIDIVMDDWEGFIESCTEEEYTVCSLVIDQEAYKNVAIRAKGNTSMTQVKNYGNDRYSFKIEFDHYDPSKSYYGLDKLCLNNIIQDNTYAKDYICYQMMRANDVSAPLCSYVYIRVNGEDFGLYLAVEGIEEAFLERNYGSDYGNLYKPDSAEPGGEMNQSDLLLAYTDDQYSSYQNIFSNTVVGKATDTDKDRLIASLKQLSSCENLERTVDVRQVIQYFVVHNFVCNFDSYTGNMIHNYYLYEKEGKMSMIPWDYNLAFGGFQRAQDGSELVNYPIDTPVSGADVDSRPMLAWIFSQQEYTEQYHRCFAEFLTEYFDSGVFAEEIERIKTMITPYVEKDPTKFCTVEEFESGMNTLKEFCLLRTQSIQAQLAGELSSTSDGQKQNQDQMVDTSGIEVSAMGGMEHGNPGQAAAGKSQENQQEGLPAMARMAPPSGNMPENTTEPQDSSHGESTGSTTVAQGSAKSEKTESTMEAQDSAQSEKPESATESQGSAQSEKTDDTTGTQSSQASKNPLDSKQIPGVAAGTTQESESEQKNMPERGMPQGKPGENTDRTDDHRKELQQRDTDNAELSAKQRKSAWILVVVSALVLIAGILIAFFY